MKEKSKIINLVAIFTISTELHHFVVYPHLKEQSSNFIRKM